VTSIKPQEEKKKLPIVCKTVPMVAGSPYVVQSLSGLSVLAPRTNSNQSCSYSCKSAHYLH